jgi:alpha-beta hydrolase superfamily lysophospholipase
LASFLRTNNVSMDALFAREVQFFVRRSGKLLRTPATEKISCDLGGCRVQALDGRHDQDSSRLPRNIRSLTAPVLVLHGKQDTVIPVEMGRRVYRAANEPKRIELFPDGALTICSITARGRGGKAF